MPDAPAFLSPNPADARVCQIVKKHTKDENHDYRSKNRDPEHPPALTLLRSTVLDLRLSDSGFIHIDDALNSRIFTRRADLIPDSVCNIEKVLCTYTGSFLIAQQPVNRGL